MRTTKSEAAARKGARLGARKRGELLALLRPCFVRVEPWLQAGKYMSALVSGLPKRNGWTIAEHAGDRAPDRTQRQYLGCAGKLANGINTVHLAYVHEHADPLRQATALHWQIWRRRPQARARWYHQRARLARDASIAPLSPSLLAY